MYHSKQKQIEKSKATLQSYSHDELSNTQLNLEMNILSFKLDYKNLLTKLPCIF